MLGNKCVEEKIPVLKPMFVDAAYQHHPGHSGKEPMPGSSPNQLNQDLGS